MSVVEWVAAGIGVTIMVAFAVFAWALTRH
jgi:uncharacterized protein (TIGR03382 family)